MAEYVNVAVDADGGDNAPLEIVKGAVDALKSNEQLKVTLFGNEKEVRDVLEGMEYPSDRLEIVPATEKIEMAEPPVIAIRRKKESSIVLGMKAVHDGSCDAFVTAGSTGATLVGGQVLVGRIKGVERPPLAPLLPSNKGPFLLIDCGANVDARASHLVQFAQMGSIYMEKMLGIKNPRVGLLSIGAEEEKGNALVKEVYPLLKELEGINFIGNVESRDIPQGVADVVVCDAFTGNAVLKMYEGVAKVLLSEIKGVLMSSLLTKIAALIIKNPMKKTLSKFDTKNYGGAPLLGLNGLVVKTHGSAKAVEVKNSIEQCISWKKADINGAFIDRMNLVDHTRKTEA